VRDHAAEVPTRTGFYFRAGALFLKPMPSSGPVLLANVDGPARLALNDGPIAGSSVGMGSNFMPAAIVGWAPPILDGQLSIETVLAVPFTMKLLAKGTLATDSLAPTVLGSLPTGVPALGDQLGEATVLPPVVTLVYRFWPDDTVRPYLGAGLSYLVPLHAQVTNPILTEVSSPQLSIPAVFGWVVQGGFDLRFFERFVASLDIKYIGGLDVTATTKDIWVRLHKLPLYGAVHVGDNIAQISVNPLAVQAGVGMDL
jgi:outer membrane protein